MNNTTLAPTDPRAGFAQAVATARAVVDGVQPHQLELATPCEEMDVRLLMGHMVIVFRRLAALGNGTDPMDMPNAISGVADHAWPQLFADAAHDVQSAWADDAKLQQMMVLPWATRPGADMLRMYTAELIVHTWDLAQATGQSVEWHEPTVALALESALQALPPGDREALFATMNAELPEAQRFAAPFKNPVSTADDASTIDRLVGWYGRQPSRAA